MIEELMVVKSPFLLADSMGYVQPSIRHQFGSYDYDKVITNAIANAVAEQMAYDDMYRRQKFDWLPEIHRKIEDGWAYAEALVLEAREFFPIGTARLS